MKRDSRLVMIKTLESKTSAAVAEACGDFKIDVRRVWRFHSDMGGEFYGAMDQWMRDNGIARTTTGGYDPAANGIAERMIQEIVQGVRAFPPPERRAEDLVERGGVPLRRGL